MLTHLLSAACLLCPCYLDCDCNDNGMVDAGDLGIVLTHWGATWDHPCGDRPAGDVDCSGTVDAVDIAYLFLYWGWQWD